jgi:purine-binding chemotaxis protein CheW
VSDMKDPGHARAPLDWSAVRARLAELERATAALLEPSGEAERARLELRARSLARPLSTEAPSDALELFTFSARTATGVCSYALQRSDVLEVARPSLITRLPAMPEHVLGLMHHRGEPLAVFSLAVLLGASPGPAPESARILVLGRERVELGLQVDALIELRRVSTRELRPPPGVGPSSALALGWVAGEVAVLDADRLLADPRLFVGSESDRSEAPG